MRLSSFVAALSILGVVPAAFAADLPVKLPMKAPIIQPVPLYDWSGFYIGGHVGYFWGHTTVDEDNVVAEHNAHTNGVVGGALAGYNWQFGPVVAGLEGDFGWTNAHGTGTIPTITVDLPNHYDANWIAHARGRVGYAFNNWLLFAAGGASFADFTFTEGGSITIPNPNPGGRYTGWSVGAGVETAVTHNLIARLEFLYDDFGHKDYPSGDGDIYRVRLTGETVRGALSWKFDSFGRL